MPARKHVAPELTAQGKYLYEQTMTPTDEIGAMMGLSRTAFYRRVKELGWTQRRWPQPGKSGADFGKEVSRRDAWH